MAIALVGVLTAIALPIYSGYRLKVENAQAQQDVVPMSAAIQNYWVYNRALPNSLADIGMAGKLDPWGHPYAYYNIEENGTARARTRRSTPSTPTSISTAWAQTGRPNRRSATRSASMTSSARTTAPTSA